MNLLVKHNNIIIPTRRKMSVPLNFNSKIELSGNTTPSIFVSLCTALIDFFTFGSEEVINVENYS